MCFKALVQPDLDAETNVATLDVVHALDPIPKETLTKRQTSLVAISDRIRKITPARQHPNSLEKDLRISRVPKHQEIREKAEPPPVQISHQMAKVRIQDLVEDRFQSRPPLVLRLQRHQDLINDRPKDYRIVAGPEATSASVRLVSHPDFVCRSRRHKDAIIQPHPVHHIKLMWKMRRTLRVNTIPLQLGLSSDPPPRV